MSKFNEKKRAKHKPDLTWNGKRRLLWGVLQNRVLRNQFFTKRILNCMCFLNIFYEITGHGPKTTPRDPKSQKIDPQGDLNEAKGRPK